MEDDPVDEYLDEREKRAAAQKAQDVQLWQTWRSNPSPQTLQPLLQRFDSDVSRNVRRLKAPNVSESALRADLQGHAIRAFESYDPNKSALGTHVSNMMRKGVRFVHQTQNLAYIPEGKAELIGPIDSAIDALKDEHGRDPTHQEIARYVNDNYPRRRQAITAQQVQTIQKGRLRDVFASGFESDPTARQSPREQEVLSVLRYSLKPDEQAVFDHLYGLNGRARMTSTGQIATRLGKSPSQISRIKKRIEDEYKKAF